MNIFAKTGKTITKTMLAACLGFLTFNANAQQNDNVVFLLDWLPGGEFAAYYAGVSKGFFEEQGINLQINRGFGGGDTVNKVATNSAQFGFADMSAALSGASKTGVPIRIISSMYTHSPHSIFVLESSGITSISELAGKRVGITPGNSHGLYFPTVAQAANLNPESVQWVNVDGAVMYSLLYSKELDAIPLFALHEYHINKTANEYGESIRVLPYVDEGFLIYAPVIVTNERTAQENPDLVRRFLAGMWKSIQWAHENPQEACALHVQQNPEVKLDSCIGTLQAADQYVFNDFSRQVGLGQFEEGRLQATWQEVVKAQQLDPQWDYRQIINTSFLPQNQ